MEMCTRSTSKSLCYFTGCTILQSLSLSRVSCWSIAIAVAVADEVLPWILRTRVYVGPAFLSLFRCFVDRLLSRMSRLLTYITRVFCFLPPHTPSSGDQAR